MKKKQMKKNFDDDDDDDEFFEVLESIGNDQTANFLKIHRRIHFEQTNMNEVKKCRSDEPMLRRTLGASLVEREDVQRSFGFRMVLLFAVELLLLLLLLL